MSEEQSELSLGFFVDSIALYYPVGSWGNEEQIQMEFFVSYVYEPVETGNAGDFLVAFILPASAPIAGSQAALPETSSGVISWEEGEYVKRYVLRRIRGGTTEYLYSDLSWNTVDDVTQLMSFIPESALVTGQLLGGSGIVPSRFFTYDDYQSGDIYEVAAESISPLDPQAGTTPVERGRSDWRACNIETLDSVSPIGRLTIQRGLVR